MNGVRTEGVRRYAVSGAGVTPSGSGRRAPWRDGLVHAFAHPLDPEVAVPPMARVEAPAVVLDHRGHGRIFTFQQDADPRSTRVLEHVRERFLHDPVRGEVDSGGKLDRLEFAKWIVSPAW